MTYFQVDVTWFYMNCLADTCSCSRGGDCECFCTSVAAYAQRCCHQGVPVDWRAPSLCRKSLLISVYLNVINIINVNIDLCLKLIYLMSLSSPFSFIQHMIVNSTTKVRACPAILAATCLSNFELRGLTRLPACSSGERTFQADHLQGQDDTPGSQQVQRAGVPQQQQQQQRVRSPVTLHDDAWPQQGSSSRCVTSDLTSVVASFLRSYLTLKITIMCSYGVIEAVEKIPRKKISHHVAAPCQKTVAASSLQLLKCLMVSFYTGCPHHRVVQKAQYPCSGASLHSQRQVWGGLIVCRFPSDTFSCWHSTGIFRPLLLVML